MELLSTPIRNMRNIAHILGMFQCLVLYNLTLDIKIAIFTWKLDGLSAT